MAKQIVVIGSKYFEIMNARIEDILKNKETPVPLSDLKSKLNSFAHRLGVKCYCHRCKHESIAIEDAVYDVYPGVPNTFGVIKASCIENFWKPNLLKMDCVKTDYEGIRNN